ncbi:hypothetical protein [Adhaeretor mobilis]|uniref:PEP-CTERM protein-sorting domain-containing protein n=1 Tax=Adhaeretor mobilis TaxID=1930276 RepID=A0A517N0D2_9BACT|nr:hypothetical protein [Adhaeretor mobilis]QDT00599.1 hypothetical protein HG15A2_39380 [Adhaeretor mobilis]
MKRSLFQLAFAMLLLFQLTTQNAQAQTILLQDDFQDGTNGGWGSPNGSTTATNIANAGPDGAGDNAIDVAFNNLSVVLNNAQWSGDWTAQGFQQIAFDVKSPSNNPTDLTLWLGIVQGPLSFGSGDNYVSAASQTVPSDDQWHQVVFNVDATSWTDVGGSDIADALTNVSQLRITHNPTSSFVGVGSVGGLQLDNITALGVPEPTSALLAMVGLLSVSCGRRRRG